MRMTETAAIRSPKKRALRERKEADKPVKKRAGTVPSPKAVVTKNPLTGFPVAEALTIMAQERRQGRKPVAKPRPSFDETLWERKRGGKIRPQKEFGPKDGSDKSGKGRIFKRTNPRRTINAPAARVKPPRRLPRTWLKAATWAKTAASAPSRP